MTYYIVTGAAGFIGSKLVEGLNRRGITEIIAVDNLAQADKFKNLAGCEIADYIDQAELPARLELLEGSVEAVLHQGACSDTMETDGRYMMENNYQYSLDLLAWCQAKKIPFIYASSASVYGAGRVFKESREHERPLNVYGYSKFLFDQAVRRMLGSKTAQVAGFRYFNVYGPREAHKDATGMSSVAWQFFRQYRAERRVRLFEESAGYGPGEQRRDFVSVEDVVKVNLHFLDHPETSGVFNLGTGRAQTFNDVAAAVINACRRSEGQAPLELGQMRDQGLIQYIAFPDKLKGKYQSFTQADLGALRRARYGAPFLAVEEGVARYVGTLIEAER
jgi:ADP-L-glycero-D-manno-heptose 6-epimerase